MAEQHEDTGRFREARFTRADLSDVRIRDCNLRGLKVTDSMLVDVDLSGLIGNLRVNGVDVVPLVEAELDRRHPERARIRDACDPASFRAAWDTIESMWTDTVSRAQALPEGALYERVDDEWSFVETLRHLVFATDAWALRTVRDEPRPFDPMGLTHSSYPDADARALGIDVDRSPTFEEVLPVREQRMATVRQIVDELTVEELARPCTRSPAPGYPEELRPVGACLKVVFIEEWEHHQYAVRDLAALEARQ